MRPKEHIAFGLSPTAHSAALRKLTHPGFAVHTTSTALYIAGRITRILVACSRCIEERRGSPPPPLAAATPREPPEMLLVPLLNFQTTLLWC